MNINLLFHISIDPLTLDLYKIAAIVVVGVALSVYLWTRPDDSTKY